MSYIVLSKQMVYRYSKYKKMWLSWSWSYGSWIYNYLSSMMLWVRILLRRDMLDTTLYDKVCQWFATGRWFSHGTPGTPVSSTNKTYRHYINDILLKVALNTITIMKRDILMASIFSHLFSWIQTCIEFIIQMRL